ncbi:sugar transferase [Mycobacterium sp. CPCC 205372]|uniref:Sugar transferase n=1 Tax=Mycobacterium hippophais TaxID=3016340 RepID=A0ABT4PRW3_9MYCO|nr:sugar transferase [Mycobacterium hippophais]MCZ8379305.1 sugar transferase [Mycobacterium hippophais]
MTQSDLSGTDVTATRGTDKPRTPGPVSTPNGSQRDADGGSVGNRSPGSIARLLTDGAAGRAAARHWQQSYARRVLVVDAIIVISALAAAQIGRFHLLPVDNLSERADWGPVTALSAALGATWLLALTLVQSRDVSLVGVGTEEYRRVVSATAWVFGAAAVGSLLLQTDLSRGYLVIALPSGLIGLLVGRHLLRRQLAHQRANGRYTTRVVVLGKPSSIAMLCDHFDRSTPSGYVVAGVCIPGYDREVGADLITAAGVVPVLGDEQSVERAIELTQADAIAITAVEHLGHDKMRELAWRLDSLDVDMIVVPGMTDIAGPRLKLRPIDNLPLFHIARPRHDGVSMYPKRAFDLVVGAAALLALTPMLLVAALAIKYDDGGPVFFRQERVGLHGRRFRIWKFRTMSTDAEATQSVERASTDPAGSIFFKSASDSRITRVGRFLRKTSIDEVPQLFNVLSGSMSLVGPRPLVPGEGASVNHFVERRSLVKPGMTGLWQISGRSDVSEEERIRLDHSYVDNWSPVTDLVIVWRTVRAVLRREGAY